MAKPTFNEFIAGLEDEAKAEGPEAVEELEAFRAHFRLAREFAEARKAKGWTQRELGKRCGIDQAEISNIERGRANSTSQTLSTLARHLDCRIGLVALADSRPIAQPARRR